MTGPALRDGLHDVPRGKLACVVTSLEMHAPPSGGPRRDAPAGFELRRVHAPAADWYRAVTRTVGEDWLWWTRLTLADADLLAIICDPAVEVYSLMGEGADTGLVELDFRKAGECELAYFGLAGGLTGRGIGPWLMEQAIARAWSHPIERFWVHTCTLDHPAALRFYQRSGFAAFKVAVEIADDPRGTGVLPETAAPGVPRLSGMPGRASIRRP